MGTRRPLDRAPDPAAGQAAVLHHRRTHPRSGLVSDGRACELRRIAAHVGVRRRFAPHQLGHAHPIEMAHEGFQGESRNVAEFRARAFFTTDLLALELNELGTLVNARDATSRIQQFLGEIPPMSWESSESPLDS